MVKLNARTHLAQWVRAGAAARHGQGALKK
jgi:hypothetical protein